MYKVIFFTIQNANNPIFLLSVTGLGKKIFPQIMMKPKEIWQTVSMHVLFCFLSICFDINFWIYFVVNFKTVNKKENIDLLQEVCILTQYYTN